MAEAEPLATWDTRDHGSPWWGDHPIEISKWAVAHIADANSTYRVEFFLVDAPFAVVCRYTRNDHGHCFTDPETGDIARDEPVVQVLDELPPTHLLGR
jgi:hypothetical protein